MGSIHETPFHSEPIHLELFFDGNYRIMSGININI